MSTALGASTRSRHDGTDAHGAPVCLIWKSSEGSHGRYRSGHGPGHDREQAEPFADDDRRRDREPHAQEERPVVRVDHQGETDHQEGRERATAPHDRLEVGEADDEREERLELVHARLLRVVGQVWVQRREQRAAEPGHAIERDAPERIRKRNARDPEHQRQRMRRALAVAEPRHPDAQQEVVRRR